jgi:fused signal recognition particle receptor
MFGFLKKKLDSFSDKLKHKVKEDVEILETPKTSSQEELLEQKHPITKPVLKEEVQPVENVEEQPLVETIKEKILETKVKEDPIVLEKPKELEEPVKKTPPKETVSDPIIQEEVLEQTPREKIKVLKANEDKRELKAKIGTTGKLKGLFSGKVEIKEDKIEELVFELELSLLESDVEQDTAHEITSKIKERLIGQKLSIKNLDEFLKEQIKEILTEMMTTDKLDVLKEIKNSEKPYIIMMLGPNGAGKTTHIAKLTHYFKKHNLSCVWAAADTFRSGAIHQLQEHADKLETKVIKQQYGADPAAVAFDALSSAKANKYDVILIDTAGRQETNKNLMEELKKIERVVSPNLKIYVGESYTGQGLLAMAEEFDKAIGIDGFILSKIDADAKGGTTISLLYKLKKPILYVGTGQEYEDLQEFTPEFILDRII